MKFCRKTCCIQIMFFCLLMSVLLAEAFSLSCMGRREFVFSAPLPYSLGIAPFDKTNAVNTQETKDFLFFWEEEYFTVADLARIEQLIVYRLRTSGSMESVIYPAAINEDFQITGEFSDLTFDEEYTRGYDDFPDYTLYLTISYKVVANDSEPIIEGSLQAVSKPGENPEIVKRNLWDEADWAFYEEYYNVIYPAITTYLNSSSAQ